MLALLNLCHRLSDSLYVQSFALQLMFDACGTKLGSTPMQHGLNHALLADEALGLQFVK